MEVGGGKAKQGEHKKGQSRRKTRGCNEELDICLLARRQYPEKVGRMTDEKMMMKKKRKRKWNWKFL